MKGVKKMPSDFNILDFLQILETKCSKVTRRSFNKGETITTYLEKRYQLCILLNGEADLVRYDFSRKPNYHWSFYKT